MVFQKRSFGSVQLFTRMVLEHMSTLQLQNSRAERALQAESRDSNKLATMQWGKEPRGEGGISSNFCASILKEELIPDRGEKISRKNSKVKLEI